MTSDKNAKPIIAPIERIPILISNLTNTIKIDTAEYGANIEFWFQLLW
ncbi:MAG TPA: hypothetical protein VIY98_02810 [Nitrososphaeraceae archaeon]